ncbi:Uncharacterized membrane protein [Cohaesibacter sp. ES.047]|uniref:DUF2189 domain-containing protein n=1 Tax=Cohaesibacter sp. ES.047 TaxID=1798205 RepID=UPI000BB890CD|nr:DUF2189 domain-containing protein [Cohaesibacter sp. ES.047]SNY91793.1 Uncharacterized membrane protein [Cohaesibacter sp. ES.047]
MTDIANHGTLDDAPAAPSSNPSTVASLNEPQIRDLTTEDLTYALSAGMRDLQHSAPYGLFFGAFYALAGWLLLWLLSVYSLPYLVYPLASGFALIAPFIAAGLYEISRRREYGLPLSPGAVFGAIFGKETKELRWMALVTGFAFIIWIDIAIFLYVIFFGLEALSPSTLISTVVATPEGALFLVVGNLAGAGLGLAVFSITAISFPMLLHRDVDFITGMITSIRCVLANRKAMLSWAIFIAFMMLVSLASLLLGLIVILPLLGHATWHLYRRAIILDETAIESNTSS